jgi:hypothetical protein
VARWALLLTAVSAALLLLIRAQPVDDWRLEQFFGQDTCASMPCWQGIRPGVTPAADAVDILKKHPWVGQVSDVNAVSYGSDAGLVNWSWSSRYPFTTQPNTAQQGIMIVRGKIVEQLYITTDIPLGAFWLTLGHPSGGTIDYVSEASLLLRSDNMALFGQEGLLATARLYMNCESIYADVWHTPVSVWLQDGQAFPFDHTDYDLYLKKLRTGFHSIRGAMC